MKLYALAALAGLTAIAGVPASAQRVVPIGNIARVSNTTPRWWSMSGFFILKLDKTDGRDTPIMRTEKLDARTVEIMSRTQTPRLTSKDIKVVGNEVIVRRYLLIKALPQDAQAAGMSEHALAVKWASSVGKVLPQIAPLPGRFGI